MKYRFINDHREEFRIKTMCRVLKASPAGFYAWLQQPLSARAIDNERLLGLIRDSYVASGGVYGSPRVYGDLREAGEQFFGMLAGSNTTTHYTLGSTYGWRSWEISAYWAHAPRQLVRGNNSIPAALGGGEARGSFKLNSWGLSLGKTFGGPER